MGAKHETMEVNHEDETIEANHEAWLQATSWWKRIIFDGQSRA